MASSPREPRSEPSKLRDSCNSCAVSKIKCDKEKPICGRCAKRGRRCEYFATRRAGRKHEPRQQDSRNNGRRNTNGGSPVDTQANMRVSPAINTTENTNGGFTATWDVCMPEDMTFQVEPVVTPPNAPCSTNTPALPANDKSSWRIPSSSTSEANDLFASQMSFSILDTSDQQLFHTAVGKTTNRAANEDSHGNFDLDDFSTLLVAGNHLVMDVADPSGGDQFQFSSAAWDLPALPTFSSSLSSPPSSITSPFLPAAKSSTATSIPERSGSESLGSSGPSGCCLIQALELLKKLFPGSATCTCIHNSTCTEAKRNGPDQHIPTIQRVIAENKQTLESIHAMLQCPCVEADSSYLLAVISLVVCKVLAWYKAAVQGVPVETQQPNIAYKDPCHAELVLQAPGVVDGYCLDGDDKARMAGQLVLSELHRVQRLINVLASRRRPSPGSLHVSPAELPFFSPFWVEQLETDLRKRVRALSLEIVELLSR